MSRRLWTFVCQHKQLLHRRKNVTHFQKELEENKANVVSFYRAGNKA